MDRLRSSIVEWHRQPMMWFTLDVHFTRAREREREWKERINRHTELTVKHTQNGQTATITMHTPGKKSVIVVVVVIRQRFVLLHYFMLSHPNSSFSLALNSYQPHQLVDKKTHSVAKIKMHTKAYHMFITTITASVTHSSWLPFLMNLNRAILFYFRCFFANFMNTHTKNEHFFFLLVRLNWFFFKSTAQYFCVEVNTACAFHHCKWEKIFIVIEFDKNGRWTTIFLCSLAYKVEKKNQRK